MGVRQHLYVHVFQVVFQAFSWYVFGIHMGAQATRLSDLKVKAAKPKEKDYAD
jgi:hypothetical protein